MLSDGRPSAGRLGVSGEEVWMETPERHDLDDDRFRAVIYQLLQGSGLMLRTREH